MEILYLLIPLSLVFVVLAVGAFFWAVRSGQFEDLEGPAHRILFDDEPPAPAKDGSNEDGRGAGGTGESADGEDGRCAASPSERRKQSRP